MLLSGLNIDPALEIRTVLDHDAGRLNIAHEAGILANENLIERLYVPLDHAIHVHFHRGKILGFQLSVRPDGEAASDELHCALHVAVYRQILFAINLALDAHVRAEHRRAAAWRGIVLHRVRRLYSGRGLRRWRRLRPQIRFVLTIPHDSAFKRECEAKTFCCFLGVDSKAIVIGELQFAEDLGLAIVLGAIIGLERELRGHDSGIKTNALVSAGAAIFMMLTGMLNDNGRVAAQVVTGIGFLGAGNIMRAGDHVKGLTTAATLWVVAGVGMAAGTSRYRLAIVAAAGVLAVNLALFPIERRLSLRRRQAASAADASGGSSSR